MIFDKTFHTIKLSNVYSFSKIPYSANHGVFPFYVYLFSNVVNVYFLQL